MTIVAALLLGVSVQAPKKKDADLVDPVRVDQAIQMGVAFLRTAGSPASHEGMRDSDELILLTLLHADVPPTDPKVQVLLKKILDAPIEHTYQAALQRAAGSQRLENWMDAGEDHSGRRPSPLLKRLVKLARAATSVISTTCAGWK